MGPADTYSNLNSIIPLRFLWLTLWRSLPGACLGRRLSQRMYFRKCIPKGGTIKINSFLTGELRHYGVAHIRLVASSLPPRYPLKAKWYYQFSTVIPLYIFIDTTNRTLYDSRPSLLIKHGGVKWLKIQNYLACQRQAADGCL